jgi:hypothetical protein
MAKHNDLVLEVGKALTKLKLNGEVYADHVSTKARKTFGFAGSPEPLEVPSELLAAFVPTQCLFSRNVILAEDWAIPDLVFQSGQKRYIVDVCGAGDPNTKVAQKIETVIHNALRWNVFGVALIPMGTRPAQKKAFERLVETFQLLFGEHPMNTSDVREYLRILFAKCEPTKHVLVDWDRIRIIPEAEWKGELQKRITAAFQNQQPLVAPATRAVPAEVASHFAR